MRRRAVLDARLIRYFITDSSARGGDLDWLLRCISRAARDDVDMIQIREKELSARALLDLTRRALENARGTRAKVLVNDRADIAIAAGAAGVHLPSRSIRPEQLRRILPDGFTISVSCHTIEDVYAAAHADFIVFGSVFDTPGKGPAVGLDALREAAAASAVPVLALGGITNENATACVNAGAAGIAAIRLFQNGCE